jgi:hypothetical protein
MVAAVNETYVSSSRIRSMIKAEIRANNLEIEKAVGTALGVRCAELEAQINRLQSAVEQFRFVPWSEGKTFRAGNLCSLGGALYACIADTSSRPPDSSGWVLLAPPEPPQRTVRSAR